MRTIGLPAAKIADVERYATTVRQVLRGESVTFAVMAGTQVQNYQLAFAEPYVFDRPITAGVNPATR